jgi:hypothetical protein
VYAAADVADAWLELPVEAARQVFVFDLVAIQHFPWAEDQPFVVAAAVELA